MRLWWCSQASKFSLLQTEHMDMLVAALVLVVTGTGGAGGVVVGGGRGDATEVLSPDASPIL